MNDFGKRIKELRIAAGMSQAKLAEQLSITVKSIQRYEGGYRPDTYALVKLATYFNVSTDYLLGLKSYKELIKEKKEKLKGANGYSELYRDYLKCLNNYEIVDNAIYYWIEMADNYIGGQTEWIDWADEKHTLEIRKLRPVKPREAIEKCTKINGKPMVINTQKDAMVFLIYGGQAVVREEICKKYLPQFWGSFIELNSEVEKLTNTIIKCDL